MPDAPSGPPRPRPGWIATGLTALAAGAFAGGAVLNARLELSAIVRGEPGVPLWDEAAQGFAGLRVAEALRHLRPLELLGALNEQVVWPPLQSVLLAPSFLAFGSGFETPARAATWLFALLVLAAIWAGAAATSRGVGPYAGDPPADAHALTRMTTAGIGVSAALLFSPLPRAFGTLGMLEVPGALLALAAFWLAGAEFAAPRTARRYGALAGVAAAALFLLKYNYGLLWLAPLAIVEWTRLPAGLRAAWRGRAAAWLASGGWRRPLPLLLGAWALLVAAIAVTGGFAFEVGGRRVSLRSWGNPGYGLLVAATLWGAIAVLRNRATWRAAWAEIPPRTRALLAWAGVPILAWLLVPYPNRVKALAGFVANRASGPSPFSPEGLLDYPRAFAEGYAPDPALGWTAFALALVPPRRGAPAAARLAWWALVAGLLATWLHRYHDPRFLFTVAPFVWVNAARATADGLEAALSRAPRGVAAAAWGVVLAALVPGALLAAWPVKPAGVARRAAALDARVREVHRAYRAPDAVTPILGDVLDHAVRAPGGPAPAVLLGYSNALSPGLLSWRMAQEGGTAPGGADAGAGAPVAASLARRLEALPKRPPALPENAAGDAIAARLDRLLDPPCRIVAALPFPEAQGYAAMRAELWADSVTTGRLMNDPRVVVTFDSRTTCGTWRVRVFDPR